MVVTADLLYPRDQVHAIRFLEESLLTSSSSSSADRPIDAGHAVYGISVAAELVGSAPQNLRLYEAKGLLTPARSAGGTRRYSGDDLARLREIGRLLDNGLNLAGITAVLELQAANRALQQQLNQERARAKRQQPAQ
jgi:MerR family transcriptional regulator/heat shock protein HspR